MSRAKYYCFTLNNPTYLPELFRCEDIQYAVFQEEIGEQGTPHIQGYIILTARKRITQLKTLIPDLARAHFEVARGSPQQNYDYCTKEDTRMSGPYEYGTLPAQAQGKRSDILALRDSLKSGKRFLEMADDDSVVVPLAKYMRFVERYQTETVVHPDRSNLKVIFHYGPAGTGKTHCCHHGVDPKDIYFYDAELKGFWDGYTGQSTIVLDEFTGHFMTPTNLNRLLDIYPFTLNLKGRSTPLCATTIHITANYLPSTWWKEGTRYNQEALFRRIHEVHHHYAYKAMRIYKSDNNGYAMDKLVGYLNNPNTVIPNIVN